MTGAKFLELNKVDELSYYSAHASEKLAVITDRMLSFDELAGIFRQARLVKYEKLWNMGYRPNYLGRKEHGEDTWYFMAKIRGYEFVIVVGRNNKSNLSWVTTLLPDRQTIMQRIVLEPA